MKGRAGGRGLALGLAALLLASGCSSMLDRDYAVVETHNTTPTVGASNTLKVASYQELVNALIYLIDTDLDTGTIRFEGTDQDIKTMLDNACLEVVKEDPLGAYAVEYIKYNVAPVVGSYEARVQITYRRTREQIAAISDATGTSAIRTELQEALENFASEVVLRISYFEGDEAYIQGLVREAYLANPASALDFPEATVTMYPDQGQRRIVEVLLQYHMPNQTLESHRNSLTREARRLVAAREGAEGDVLLEQLMAGVLGAGGYLPEGGDTAYDALLQGGANHQGLALALALLCQEGGLECQVVDGTLEGQPHVWNVVRTQQGWRHVDLSREPGEWGLDETWSQRGYTWNQALVPACTQDGV